MKNQNKLTRRDMLKSTIAMAVGLSSTHVFANSVKRSLAVTPKQIEGPFYPVMQQADTDLDLTQIAGHTQKAKGEIVEVVGKVMDENGDAIPNAVVDVWQANAAGRYAHAADTNPAPLDEHFQGWGIVTTNQDGVYRFLTIKPGAYKVSGSWSRPPHIHFKVSKRGYREVTTQMYFAGEALNDTDSILNDVPAATRDSLIVNFANTSEASSAKGSFNIVLAKI